MVKSPKIKPMGLYGGISVFAATMLFLLYKGAVVHLFLLAGMFCILYTTSDMMTGSLLASALLVLLYLYLSRSTREGFEGGAEDAEAEEEEPEMKEGFEETKPKKATKKRTPPPDHGDRAEMLQLGKKYKMPTEAEDSEFHLDSGTTFMNAYKALKPDQVAAMTKDTQELMETQKQLMSTLHTLKPLITDGKQMMDMFQSYFGAGNPTAT